MALGALKELEEHDPDEVASIVGLFLSETRSRLDELGASHSDPGALARTAHNLKGSCATFAATTMASTCGELEHASESSDPQFVDATLAKLNEQYERVATALRSSFPLSSS